MPKISAYIIAYNEEDKIEDALKSIAWVDEIVVADSHSRDRTAEISRLYTDTVVQIDFEGFGNLRNDAVTYCSHEWIFSLDTDELCTPDAKEEIIRIINAPGAADAYLVPRKEPPHPYEKE